MVRHVALLLILAMPVSANAGFQSGNALLRDINTRSGPDYMFAMGYVAGVFDALADVTHCVTADGVTQGQAVLIAKKYLEAHPEELHMAADELLSRAFKNAFPCAEKP